MAAPPGFEEENFQALVFSDNLRNEFDLLLPFPGIWQYHRARFTDCPSGFYYLDAVAYFSMLVINNSQCHVCCNARLEFSRIACRFSGFSEYINSVYFSPARGTAAA